MPQLHELWHLCILHAWSSQHFLCQMHPQGFEMAVLCGAGSLSNRADLTLHLSCPPFHLLTFLTLQVEENSGCWWQAEVESAGSKLQALCRCKGFHPEGCVFPLGNWGMETLDLSLISCHNKGYSGTLLESNAAVGQSRAAS